MWSERLPSYRLIPEPTEEKYGPAVCGTSRILFDQIQIFSFEVSGRRGEKWVKGHDQSSVIRANGSRVTQSNASRTKAREEDKG
ncbi:hypothetical protein NQZ68_014357 [Dissostichus eleginoides]|nr:hypothetical protein NQZ68_014357 [Dissostichus eleginoides]